MFWTAPSSRDAAPCSGLGDSGFQVSEFRILYGVWGGAGPAHEQHIRIGSDMACLTWSDIGCPRGGARLRGYGVRIRDRKGRKEGGATGRNRGNAGSGVAGRVDTGSGQQKTPRGNLGGDGAKEWPTIGRCLRGR